MANRRKFLAGLGALASGSAAAIGTGAFTSVTADRQVDVQVADDANAYLGLTPSNGNNGVYAEDLNGNEVAVDFNDIDDGNSSAGNVTNGGTGVNPDADTTAESVLTVTNQGTQSVEVDLTADDGTDDLSVDNPGSISAPSSDGISAALATNNDQLDSGTSSPDSDETVELDPGKSVDIDFAINSGTSGSLSGELTIEGDAN